jgi:hypothetical protein
MGWGRMLLLGNVGQQMDISDLERAIEEMHGEMERNDSADLGRDKSIEQLRNENHELKLYVATLIRMLAAKGIIQQEEIDAAVRAIEKT